MSSSGSGSTSRKEFDVKQILRIRWRWFGHPSVPPPHSPPLGDYFSGRRTSGSAGDGPSVSGCSGTNPDGVRAIAGAGGHGGLVASGSAGSNLCHGNGGGRKFADTPGNRISSGDAAVGATGNSCPRSFSQPECRSSAAALSWVSPPPLRMEPSGEAPAPQPVPARAAQVGVDQEAAVAAPSCAEENHPETDSSSCR